MVYLLRAFDLWWIMGEVLVDGEIEVKSAAFVHAFVGLDGECEVEDVVWVREFGLHCAAEGELREIWCNSIRVSDCCNDGVRIPRAIHLSGL